MSLLATIGSLIGLGATAVNAVSNYRATQSQIASADDSSQLAWNYYSLANHKYDYERQADERDYNRNVEVQNAQLDYNNQVLDLQKQSLYNSHQIEMADLEAAGLNPILAANNGASYSGSTVPVSGTSSHGIGSTPSGPSPRGAELMSNVSSIMDAVSRAKDADSNAKMVKVKEEENRIRRDELRNKEADTESQILKRIADTSRDTRDLDLKESLNTVEIALKGAMQAKTETERENSLKLLKGSLEVMRSEASKNKAFSASALASAEQSKTQAQKNVAEAATERWKKHEAYQDWLGKKHRNEAEEPFWTNKRKWNKSLYGKFEVPWRQNPKE